MYHNPDSVVAQLPPDIIPPASESEFVCYLLRVGDYAAARAWQNEKLLEGRRAALNGEAFPYYAPAATQRGYVEALSDLEH